MAVITNHAVQRYQERVENVSADEAAAILHGADAVIDKAAEFGCSLVVLGNGARLQLCGDRVVTVLPKRYGKKPRR